jgi:hypothetical protein
MRVEVRCNPRSAPVPATFGSAFPARIHGVARVADGYEGGGGGGERGWRQWRGARVAAAESSKCEVGGWGLAGFVLVRWPGVRIPSTRRS